VFFLRIREAVREPFLPLLIAVWLFFQAWMLLVPNEGRYRKPFEGMLVAEVLLLVDLRLRRNAGLAVIPPNPLPEAEPPSIATSPEMPI
jgi:hypothetical protein